MSLATVIGVSSGRLTTEALASENPPHTAALKKADAATPMTLCTFHVWPWQVIIRSANWPDRSSLYCISVAVGQMRRRKPTRPRSRFDQHRRARVLTGLPFWLWSCAVGFGSRGFGVWYCLRVDTHA
jgi:hypothetical protein